MRKLQEASVDLSKMSPEAMLVTKPVSLAIQTELLRRFKPLCWKLALRAFGWKTGNIYGTPDDWAQEANIALLRAMDRWHPDGGAKFITYATNGIWCYLRNIVRDKSSLIHLPARHWNERANEFATRSLTTLEGEQVPVPESAHVPPYDADELALLHKHIRKVLTPNEREAIQRRLRGEGLAVAGRAMAGGISKERVRQLQNVAVRKLRRALGVDPDECRGYVT